MSIARIKNQYKRRIIMLALTLPAFSVWIVQGAIKGVQMALVEGANDWLKGWYGVK